MKKICLYFQVHQPFRLRRYRFFDIGNDHYYYDDYTNESILTRVALKSYLEANNLLLKMLKHNEGRFKVSFSLSGIAVEQFELYAPEVLDSFKALARTGLVEFLAGTYPQSLASLKQPESFTSQVEAHARLMETHFGIKPSVFANTGLIYSDQIGEIVANMGYKAIVTEGAKHVLGWKSPNYLYCNAINPKLKVILKNYKLSDDIAFKFGNRDWCEWPLTASKFAGWLNMLDSREEVVNLFMNYETLGEQQGKETGIFDFLENFPLEVLKYPGLSFSTPSEVVSNLHPVAIINVPHPISWADEERDLTPWLGNEMQQEAFNKLNALYPKIRQCTDNSILKDWNYLQSSDHLYYMSTKFFSDGGSQSNSNPFETPYAAFINYMNVLSDFTLRLNSAVPESTLDKEIANLTILLEEKEMRIRKMEEEIKNIRKSRMILKKSRAHGATKQ